MVGSWRRLREKTDNRVIFDRKQGNFGKGVKLNFWVAALGSRRLIWWPVSSHRTSSKFYGTLKMCPITLHDCQLLDKGTLKKTWPRVSHVRDATAARRGGQAGRECNDEESSRSPHHSHLSLAALLRSAYVMGHVDFHGTTESPMFCYFQTMR